MTTYAAPWLPRLARRALPIRAVIALDRLGRRLDPRRPLRIEYPCPFCPSIHAALIHPQDRGTDHHTLQRDQLRRLLRRHINLAHPRIDPTP